MGKSKFVIGFLGGFLLGVYFGDLFKIGLSFELGVIFGLILAIVLCFDQPIWRLIFLVLLGINGGTLDVSIWQIQQAKVSLPFFQTQNFTAVVMAHPDFLATQADYLVQYQGTKIELQSARYPEFQYGDQLRINGTIKRPTTYQVHHNIGGQIKTSEVTKIGWGGSRFLKTIYGIRDQFEGSINHIFTEPSASFGAGLILGSKRNIPDSLTQAFNRTGTTHIVAVSGYNVTIMIIYAGLLLGIISRRLKFWGSLGLILVFVLMTGAGASVLRAGILAGLMVFGKNAGRRINMNILILLVADVMLLQNPFLLKYDVSFQLSYLAFAGLVYLSPLISNLKFLHYLHPKIRQTMSETLAAQIMVLPVLVINFGQASIISPLVNVLILWLVPTAMFLVFLGAIGGMVFLSLGHFIGRAAILPLQYMIWVVESFSKISWASYTIQTKSWWWALPYFLLIVVIVYIGNRRTKKTNEQTF